MLSRQLLTATGTSPGQNVMRQVSFVTTHLEVLISHLTDGETEARRAYRTHSPPPTKATMIPAQVWTEPAAQPPPLPTVPSGDKRSS